MNSRKYRIARNSSSTRTNKMAAVTASLHRTLDLFDHTVRFHRRYGETVHVARVSRLHILVAYTDNGEVIAIGRSAQ